MASSELQATLEFCLELHKFYNVDLFLRGYYKLEVDLRVECCKLGSRVEVSSSRAHPTTAPTTTTSPPQPPPQPPTTSTTPKNSSPANSHGYSATTDFTPTSTTTKPFRILFRNEETELKEIFLFRIHFQQELTSSLNMTKIVEELNRAEYYLDLKLCFNDQVVSCRTCQLHYYFSAGSLHYYRNVFFDYFHLSAVSFSIHGGVIAVHISKGTLMNCSSRPDLIPTTPTPSSPPPHGSHGNNPSSTSCLPSSSSFLPSCSSGMGISPSLKVAKITHELICGLLIESNSSLRNKLVEFLQVLGKHDLVDTFKEGFLTGGGMAGGVVNWDEFLNGSCRGRDVEAFLLKAHKQIAHLCAENILLWHRFLDLIIGRDPVRVYLANLHHQLRVKRFTEGFYITSNPARSAYTSKDYSPIVELLKKSINYTPLPVECTDIDGDSNSIPIVFEDQFIGVETVEVVKEPEIKIECSCGMADKTGGQGKEEDLTTALNAKLTLLLTTPTTSDPKKIKKHRRKTSTLPRRHSSHHHTPSRKKSRKKSMETRLRKFNSTPMGLNEQVGESSESSEESGWVGSSEGEEEEGGGGSRGSWCGGGDLLPPPPQFQDHNNKTSSQPHPPQEFLSSKEVTLDLNSTSSSSSQSPVAMVTHIQPKLTPIVKKEKLVGCGPPIPYFLIPDELRIFHPKGLHLVVAVHGLDGSSHDLRLFKIYLEVSLPGHNLQFLMSQENQDGTTFTDFSTMTTKLVSEILTHLSTNKLNPSRISFVGHSLGNIIIRSALLDERLKHLLPKLHTFLSLSGPHLGTLYNGGLVNVGMWLMQKWKKSSSLLQLQLKDASNIRDSFIYKLSEKSNLDRFKYVLLCGSSQDRYVPVHSAHVINCKASLKDGGSQGEAYREMVMNILNPILTSNSTKLIRYDVHHAINPHTANGLIGRAAHIAVLDSEIFIEKFLSVSGVKYFQ